MRRIAISLLLSIATVTGNIFAQEITPGKEVDLGLPSGTIWAGWNIGATSPEQYGDYYAWGETSTKDEYSDETNQFYNATIGKWTYIGTDISGTKYDVAYQKWGGSWKMPTQEDFDELISNCKWNWEQYNDVNGYKVTGPNGNYIFFPAAGYINGKTLNEDGKGGYYWSSSMQILDSAYSSAFNLDFIQFLYGSYGCSSRGYGLPIRPIKHRK